MDTQAQLDIAARLETLLFSEGGPVTKKRLTSLLECTEEELTSAAAQLASRREGSGIALIQTETELALAIAPEAAETMEKVFEKEIGREVGDAGLEVLAIVLYRGPSTRAQIDYIRGVNTSSTIRTLAARGLLERSANPHDAREYLYRPTAELMAYLGASDKQQLPDHAKIASELAAFEASQEPFNNHADNTNSGTQESL